MFDETIKGMTLEQKCVWFQFTLCAIEEVMHRHALADEVLTVIAERIWMIREMQRDNDDDDSN